MVSKNIRKINKYVLLIFAGAALSFSAHSFSMEFVRALVGFFAKPLQEKKDVSTEIENVKKSRKDIAFIAIDTELLSLCTNGYPVIDRIRELLGRGANINTVDFFDQTPLYRACLCRKDLGLAKFLLLNGAIPDEKCFGKKEFFDGFACGYYTHYDLGPIFVKYLEFVKKFHDTGILLPDQKDTELCEFARVLSLSKFAKKRTVFSNLGPENRSIKKTTDCSIFTQS